MGFTAERGGAVTTVSRGIIGSRTGACFDCLKASLSVLPLETGVAVGGNGHAEGSAGVRAGVEEEQRRHALPTLIQRHESDLLARELPDLVVGCAGLCEHDSFGLRYHYDHRCDPYW